MVTTMKTKNGPELRNLDEMTVAYVSFTGNYIGNADIFRGLFETLFNWAAPRQLLGPDTVLLAAYYDDPNVTPPEKLRLDVCMTIPNNTTVTGKIRKKKLPGGTYVVMRAELTGPEEYAAAWDQVVAWAMANKKEIDLSRASYEIYLNNPEDHPDKHHLLDVCLAVR